jgi:hypothetical protein
MFLVRFVTTAYADRTVTLRDAVDRWDVDIPGVYEDGAWQFQLDEARYPEQFRFKFVLDGPVYMDGYDQELQPAEGAVYEYDEATVRSPSPHRPNCWLWLGMQNRIARLRPLHRSAPVAVAASAARRASPAPRRRWR